MSALRKIFIVDTMAMAFRSFHAFGQRPLKTSSGQPTSALYGSLAFLLSLIERESPDYLIFASDSKEPTFRHELYSGYKANRTEMPEELAAQIQPLYELIDIFGHQLLKQPGLEADDLIGSLTKQHSDNNLQSYIVSGDKDFMQLVNPHTFLYSPKKAQEPIIIDEDGVRERFNCAPSQVVDILAIMGDSSDNVPGVKGIGEKGAALLIQKFGSLEGVYQNIEQISNKRQKQLLEESKQMAFLSKQLVTIKTDCVVNFDLKNSFFDKEAFLSSDRLLSYCKQMEFSSIVEKLKSYHLLGNKIKPLNSSVTPVKADKNTEHYHLITTEIKIVELLNKLAAKSIVCFDTETTGLDCINDKPIGVSFACFSNDDESKIEAYYIPLIAEKLDVDVQKVIDLLKGFFKNSKNQKLAHNIKYDWQMLRNIGIEVAPTYLDTMLAAYLIDPTRSSFKLDDLVYAEFGFVKTPITELIGADKSMSMLDVPIEIIKNYACEDAEYTLKLYKSYRPVIKDLMVEELFSTLEMPMAVVLARMEQTGMFVDTSILKSLSVKLNKMSEVLEAQIHKLAGEEFNINSTKQLQVILFEKLKVHELLNFKRLKKTKSGYSTDVSVLEKLSSHPLPKAILEYRTVNKLKSTYVDSLPQLVNRTTKRVHSSFNQTGTATGRLSSNKPNLQNIPIRTELGREIRKAFRAQDEDSLILSADYSQMELRILAHLSGDKALQDAFKAGLDIHQSTAANIFGVALSDVTPTLRSHAKSINFGIIYGMGPARLASQTGVSMSEAKDFIDKYFKSYPSIKAYIDRSIEDARNKGFTQTLLGRRRPLPQIHSKNRMEAVGAENIAINTPVQGTAADIMKLAMIAIDNKLLEQKLNSKMLLQVHDELIFEVPKHELGIMSDLVVDAMQNTVALKAPLKVELGYGESWLEAH